MKQIFPILFLFILSCSPQTTPTNDTAPETKPSTPIRATPLKILPEHDPYFTPTEAHTSQYGPANITRNILQDRKGNYWFATWEGIIGLDYKSMASGKPIFTNYTNKEGLRRFRAFSMLEDSKGNIWFGTQGAGVFRYDGTTFHNMTTNDGLVNDRIGCLYEDKAGKIWMGTLDGISVWDGKSFTNFGLEEGLPDTDINSIVEDKNGDFWIGSRGAACVYNGKEFTKLMYNIDKTFMNVRCIIKDNKDNIWLGGNDGLWKYNGNNFSNLTTNFVGYIYQDRKGNIWTSEAADSNGNNRDWVVFLRYDHEDLGNEKPVAELIKKEENMFFGIIDDTDGNIWLGKANGIYRYNGKDFEDFLKR